MSVYININIYIYIAMLRGMQYNNGFVIEVGEK